MEKVWGAIKGKEIRAMRHEESKLEILLDDGTVLIIEGKMYDFNERVLLEVKALDSNWTYQTEE